MNYVLVIWQGFLIEVHPLVFLEHRVKKLVKQSISKQLSCLFFFGGYFFGIGFTWHRKFCILSFFPALPLSSKSGSYITYGY